MFSDHSSSDKRETRLLWCIIALHLLAIALPYLWAYLIVPPDYVWGGLLFNVDDQNVHLAWAKGAVQGQFFSRDYFTMENLSDNTRPLFFNALTALIGLLSKITTLPVVTIYHFLRLIFAACALKWFHDLCAQWTNSPRVRLTAVALAAFAGGAGWLQKALPQVLAGRNFVDRPGVAFPMMPEAWGFFSAFVFTINIAAMALLCLTLARLLRYRESGNRRDLIVSALSAFVLSNIHTYDALPLTALIIVATLWQRDLKNWKSATIIIIGASLPVLYQIIVFAGSEEFRLKALTPTTAPPILDLALSYGFLLLLAIIGAWQLRREHSARWPLLWIVITFAIIYVPVSFARKMIEGVHLPLCFFAAVAIVALIERARSKELQRFSVAALVAFLSISSWQFVAWCVGENWRDNNISRGDLTPPLLLSQGDMKALHYLNALPNERKYLHAVLVLPKLGNYVPQATGFSTYIGHWAETLHLDEKSAQTIAFFTGAMTENQSVQWLRDNKIAYVIEGQYALPETLPLSRFGWQPIWAQHGTAIYATP